MNRYKIKVTCKRCGYTQYKTITLYQDGRTIEPEGNTVVAMSMDFWCECCEEPFSAIAILTEQDKVVKKRAR